MVGGIQLTSAVLPLIMNEDVENVEELGSWAFFLWLEFSATNIRELLSFTFGAIFKLSKSFPNALLLQAWIQTRDSKRKDLFVYTYSLQ